MKPGAWLVEDMVLTPDSFTFSGPPHFITYVSAHISKEEFGLKAVIKRGAYKFTQKPPAFVCCSSAVSIYIT